MKHPLVFWLSLAAACGMQVVLCRTALGPSAEWDRPPGTPAHLEGYHRGVRLVRAVSAGRAFDVDVMLNAGEASASPLACGGRFAALCIDPGHIVDGWRNYRRGLCLIAMAIPLAGALGSWLARGSAVGLAVVPWLAVALWWWRPTVTLLEAGWVEAAVFGPLAGVYLAAMSHFHRQSGPVGWLALAVTSFTGWTLCPLPWLAFLVPSTVVWLLVAHRHSWLWHGWLLLAVLGGAAPSAGRLFEFLRSRDGVASTLPLVAEQLTAWRVGHPFSALPTLAAQLALAALPWAGGRFGRMSIRLAPVVLLTALLSRTEHLGTVRLGAAEWGRWGSADLSCSPDAAHSDWLDGLARVVSTDARVLCEGPPVGERGGVSPFALSLMEPMAVLYGGPGTTNPPSWTLTAGCLGGRDLALWRDDELVRFFDRWNVGWIWTVHPATAHRLRQLDGVRLVLEGVGGTVFALDRAHRYVLKGRGRFTVTADNEVILADLAPEDGEVLLSLRYHPGWRVNPSRIGIEAEVDPYDAQPLIRLRLNGPVSRAVLRRDGR